LHNPFISDFNRVTLVQRLTPSFTAILLVVTCFVTHSYAAESPAAIIEARGQTMGTSYMVKVFSPPDHLPQDWRERIDKELRSVNDQMSTYLESSEISRFNQTQSTQWFTVSRATAEVVAKSLEVFEQSHGAFDITVASLVNLWSFGPGKRNLQPPDDNRITQELSKTGSQDLAVTIDPPAIRKSRGELTIDLSAIAKGHGVDRIVELLTTMGAENVFAEIGGEVRVTGDKGVASWTVGIQKPDVDGEVVAIAYPLMDRSIATSGDYRNYFESSGVRYSHTIDPRSGRPVRHNLASVSVLADDCMTADAWATALNVLGPVEAEILANELGLDSLLMVRSDSGAITSIGTGAFSSLTSSFAVDETTPPSNATEANAGIKGWLVILVFCFVAFAGVLVAMAVGVLFGRRSISGSCGGLANQRDPDGSISCALCSNPDNACRELKAKMQAK